jgi:N-acetylmuramoyl-L-alanine amidase
MQFIYSSFDGLIWKPSAVVLLAASMLLLVRADASAFSKKVRRQFADAIIDYRAYLNPRFEKLKRSSTRYIIIHTSQTDLKTALKLLSEGKQNDGRWISRGGHGHYVLARDGQTYLLLDEKYRANHAGLSIWNGETDISSISVSIEFVAYHDGSITDRQYDSARVLIDILKNRYRLDDLAVLTHSQEAYGRPNQWISKKHRGRKDCAQNFDRKRAGLGPTWSYDPDVRAGRLLPEPVLASIFYGDGLPAEREVASHVIDQNTTAWEIAGKKYDSPNTLYKLPDGWVISGNRIGSKIGWGSLPIGTEVLLD